MAAMAMTANAQQTVVKGDIKGIDTDSVAIVVLKSDFNREERIDKVPLKDGKFEYKVDLQELRQVILGPTAKAGERLFKNGSIRVYVAPGQAVNISGSMADYQLSGSQFYADQNTVNKLKKPYTDQMSKLNDDYRKGLEAGQNQDSLRTTIGERFDAVEKEFNQWAMDYIKANATMDAAATLVNAVDDTEAAYNLVSDQVKNGIMASLMKSVKDRIDKEKARNEAAKLVADGMPAPDFTLNDINGKPLSLSSLRGKYVILDFWGSWCIWCIRGMPKMKEYYKKYAGKFEILGVDCNDTEEKWRAAVKEHEVPWLHVYNPRSSDVTTKYAIQGYPTKIVIDPKGNIYKTIVGEDPKFYDMLDELFQ